MAKFTELYESAIQRYTRGGFLTGDLVKFRENYQSDDFFKRQGSNYIQRIDEFVKSGLNIRVSAIKPVRPTTSAPGNIQNEGESFLIDIVLEKAPGLYYEFITVPASVLEHVDTGINLAPVPDSLKYDDKLQLKPEPVNGIEADTYQSPHRQTRTTDAGNSRDSKTQISNPDRNIKIPALPADGDRDPAVAAGTARYLPANSRRRRN